MKEKLFESGSSQTEAGRLSYSPAGVYDGNRTSESSEGKSVISVFVVDTTGMGCELMGTALQRSPYKLKLAGYATDSTGVRDFLCDSDVDVAILSADLREGNMAAFEVTRELRVSHPNTSVIMMLESIERVTVIEAFRAGVAGIFSRDKSFDLLCKCIRVVHEGQIWADNKALRFLIDSFASSKSTEDAPPKKPNLLTKREEGVVQLVADGLTNRDISRQLNLSENTVRNYLFRIFNKVGTSNRLELALYAVNLRKEATSQRN